MSVLYSKRHLVLCPLSVFFSPEDPVTLKNERKTDKSRLLLPFPFRAGAGSRPLTGVGYQKDSVSKSVSKSSKKH